MFATMMSPSEDLLVIREQRASLPDLMKQGRFSPSNLRVVAQLEGESHSEFVQRVLDRTVNNTRAPKPFRAAIVSLQSAGRCDWTESRKKLLIGIATALAQRSDAELILLAPANVGAAERMELFELLEATLHSVPSQNVRLAFGSEERRPRRGVRETTASQAT
jgi:hypothetical protein